ncbi:MAG TPA: TetR/AcrR family transcriptional regulator [Rhodocyclaceae bacterium]
METASVESTPRRRGRPPKSTATALDTRAALLRCGMELLTEKGFHSTGLDELLARAGVTKGSFYHCFPSKEVFGLAVIDAYDAYFAGKLDRSLLSTERQPLDRIADFIADARAGMVRHHFRRGCLIGNLGQDSPALPEAYRDRLERVFLDWQARLARCLELARDAGLIADSANCNELAEFFWIGWEGAVLRSKLMASPRPLDVFTTAFFSMLPR